MTSACWLHNFVIWSYMYGKWKATCISWTTSSQSQNYVTADGESASLSWNKAPIWGLWPDFYYCQTVSGLLMCGALSDERTGLSFTIVAGPRQRILGFESRGTRVRVPWDSASYFTVSDSRLPFPSPLTTSRNTVEVFEPSSNSKLHCDWRSVCLGFEHHLGLMTGHLLQFDSHGLVFVGRHLRREDGSVFCQSHCLQ
jgi:hypothetical protein